MTLAQQLATTQSISAFLPTIVLLVVIATSYLAYRRENAADYVAKTKGRWHKKLEEKLKVQTVAAPSPGSFCSSCGARLNPGSSFCGSCGTPVADR